MQYSKKVMQHFMNPKNMGEIKNPDGVGEIGNPTCLLPKERILLNGKFTGIKKSKKDDLVFSHNSTENKIKGVFSRKYKGKIINLKNSLGKISITPEHLVYSIRLPEENKYKRIKAKQELLPSWNHAEDLKKGDLILYPFSRKNEDKKYVEINIKKKKSDFRSKKIPKKIPLDNDLLRLFGYFLSEGNVQDKPSKTYISFSLHIKEKDIAEDIKKTVKKLFDLKAIFKEEENKNVLRVLIYNAHLARWFKELFDNGAQNKFIPNFIMKLPQKKQTSLIKGLWKGDGCINTTRIGARAGYVTISYKLAQQIKILLLRQNIITSNYIEKEKKSKWANHKEVYRIHVGQRDSLKRLCNILNLKYSPKSHESISSWIKDNILYIPITKVEKENYEGKVYNLEVENAHSFSSEAFCLHNCGDIMKVYIKVEKDKKTNLEKIKQIKFQTFGCASAIASSSILTEMAKGKTFQEAEGIKMKDIANELQGLPPIKLHCSAMASQALKKAIEDYNSKNKN
jgi:nitrogen fixation protein NifU and related proteins